MNRPPLFRALAGNLVGEVVLRLPTLVWDVFAARRLSKFDFGVWIAFRLVLAIVQYPIGASLYGLDLRYSELVGAEQPRAARQMAGAAFFASTVGGALIALVLLLGVPSPRLRHAIVPGASAGQIACFASALILLGLQAAIGTHLRNRLKFAEMNVGLLVGHAAGLLTLVALINRYGVYACILGYAATLVASAIYWRRFIEIELPAAPLIRSHTIELCGLGVPLVIAGVLFDGLRVGGRWVVGHTAGVEVLGAYGTAYVFSGVVFLAGTASSRVLIQFLGRAEGARMPREQQLVDFVYVPGLAVAGVSCLAAVAAWIAAQVVIPWFMPKQVLALTVIRPAIYGSLPYAVAYLYITTLRAQRRFRELYLVIVATLVVYIASLIGVASLHASLWWYVATESVTFGGLLVVLVILVGRQSGAGRWAFLGTVAVMFGTTIGAMELASAVVRDMSASLWARLGAQILVAGVAALIACGTGYAAMLRATRTRPGPT